MEIRIKRQDGLCHDVKPCFPSFLCVSNFVSTLNFTAHVLLEEPASAPLSCSRSSCPLPRYKNNKLCLVLLDPRGLTQIKSVVAVTSAIRGQTQCRVWVNWCTCVITEERGGIRATLKFKTSATVINDSEEWVSGNVVRSTHPESKWYGNPKTMRLMGWSCSVFTWNRSLQTD